MRDRLVTLVLLVGVGFTILALAPKFQAARAPGNQQGYEPVQPIAYSHRLHAGELQIACLYCHFGAEQSRHAGIPPASVCMNCHKVVSAPFGAVRQEEELAQKEKRKPGRIVSEDLRKLYGYLALDGNLQPRPGQTPQPIAWVRVHRLPDFVYFDHRAHVNVGIQCQQCHGPVETMERMRQFETLTMGWCVNCHRTANQAGINGRAVQPSIDCATCHY